MTKILHPKPYAVGVDEKTVELSEEAFAVMFRPIANHLNPHASYDWGDGFGTLFETYGEELAFIRSQQPNNVWTLLSVGGCDCIVNGFHLVNRVGFILTEVAAPGRIELVVKLEEVE